MRQNKLLTINNIPQNYILYEIFIFKQYNILIK